MLTTHQKRIWGECCSQGLQLWSRGLKLYPELKLSTLSLLTFVRFIILLPGFPGITQENHLLLLNTYAPVTPSPRAVCGSPCSVADHPLACGDRPCDFLPGGSCSEPQLSVDAARPASCPMDTASYPSQRLCCRTNIRFFEAPCRACNAI